VDVYKGDKVEKGKKSYTIRMKFQDEKSTLKDTVIEEIITNIVTQLTSQLNAQIRK
jgi:phenylalanyl-tRNA synthetase beta subunit